MKYTFSMLKNKVPYFIKGLGENKLFIEEKDDTFVSITIYDLDPIDIISIFHAGVECGIEK